MGDRDPSRHALHYNLYVSLTKCLSWFFPIDYLSDILKSTRAHFVLGTIAGFLVGWAWSPSNVLMELRPAICRIGPHLLFIGIYTTLLAVISTITAHDGINDRYMSPVYVPIVLIILYFFEQRVAGSAGYICVRRFGLAGRLRMQELAVAILLAWLAFLSLRVARTATQLMQTGLGYNHISWRTSETVSYLREKIVASGDDTLIYSNNPEAVYILSGVSVSGSPEAKGYNSSEPRRPVASIAGTWPGSRAAFLVWFHNTGRAHLFEVDELEQIANIVVVDSLSDGTIYKVSTR